MEKPADLSRAADLLHGSTRLESDTSTDPIEDDAAIADDAALLDNLEFDSFVNRLEKRWQKPKISQPQSSLQRLGRFEIRRELGRGRFGVVFLAWDPQLHRHVALKVPQFDAALDPDLRERFKGEAKAAGKLQHPGIVSVHDVGQHAGVDYIAMMYVDGMTLAERLKSGPLPPQDAARLVIGLGAAIQHAHDQDVIHRDLKPSNILIDKKDQPHVMDFGLALQLSESAMRATATGQVLGTPAYMSPEQATGKSDVGPLSDVYSLGVILYEVITGRPPFQAATFVEAVEFIVNRDPLAPSKLNPKLPRELDAITFKCLEKEPRSRYQSAAALADDLQRYLDGRPILARAQGPLQRTWRWCRKYPSRALLLLTTLIAIALLLSTGSVYTRWQYAAELARQQEENANAQRYYATVTNVRNLIADHSPGWSEAAENHLQIAVKNKTSAADPIELRGLGIEALSGFDLREGATVDTKMLIGRIAFSPDGKLLAVGELKGTFTCQIVVYDTATLEPKHKFILLNYETSWKRLTSGYDRFQDGIREFAFSGDGRYLAAGMRFGTIFCFDLQEPTKEPVALPISESRELARIVLSANGKALYAVTKGDYEFLYWPDWQNEVKPITKLTGLTISIASAPQADAMFMQNMTCNELRMLTQALVPRTRFAPLNSFTKGIESDLACDGFGRLLAGESNYGLCVYETTGGFISRLLPDDTVGDEPTADELQMSNDGQLLSAFSDRGIVRIFDVANGRQAMRLTLDRHDFQDVAFDPQKRWLVVANDRELKVWSVREPAFRRVVTSPAVQVEDMQFSPNGSTLACVAAVGGGHGCYQNSLIAIDCATGEQRLTKTGGFDGMDFFASMSQLAWQPDGKALLWHAAFGTTICSAEKLSTAAHSHPLPLLGETTAIDFEVTSVEKDPKNPKAKIRRLPHPEVKDREIWAIRPHGVPIRVRGTLQAPARFQRQAATLLFSLKLDASQSFEPSFSVSINGVGRLPTVTDAPVWATGKQSEFQWYSIHLPSKLNTLKTIDLQITPAKHLRSFQLEQLHCVELGYEKQRDGGRESEALLSQLSMAKSGNRLFGILEDELHCWEYPSGKLLTTWTNPNHYLTGAGNIRCVEAGEKGTLVGTRDGRVHWLDPQRGTSIAMWQGAGREVVAAALCEPANLALAAAENGKVRGISVPGGEALFDLRAHDEAITAIAATPDAKTLVTASVDRRLRVWERSAKGYELYSQLPITSSPTSTLRISADGRYLAVLGRSTDCVELWDLQQLKRDLASLGIR
ncbi:protein kinase [Anatilimnocola sp. NA78]|uniref:protein kinase domain-containing protein n=1 Tax=Anatilimnocola sp. NA78 TaxID=3415683 RepID=UPI003CE528EC